MGLKRAKIGEGFKPAGQFKTLYYIYFFVILVLGILTWYIPVLLFAPAVISSMFSVFVIPLVLLTLYWIPKFYHSILYKLTANEMVWERGVWFKKTGIVPYNRITNIDIAQGPVSRKLGIAALKIQTAGYSGQHTNSSEIKIEGVKEFLELRDSIMGFVRGRKPVAVETYEAGTDVESRVLTELVRIRKLLEKRQ